MIIGLDISGYPPIESFYVLTIWDTKRKELLRWHFHTAGATQRKRELIEKSFPKLAIKIEQQRSNIPEILEARE